MADSPRGSCGEASIPMAGDSRSDSALVEGLARREDGAMEELLRRHHGRIWGLAYRLTHDAASADDLAQETFVRLYQTAGRYRATAALTTFLHRIVVNLAIDARRSRRPVLRLAGLENDPPARAEPERLEAEERGRRVEMAVAALPARQRAAVVLHRYEGLPYQEIAQVLGTTEAAVESLIMRGYAELRMALSDLREK